MSAAIVLWFYFEGDNYGGVESPGCCLSCCEILCVALDYHWANISGTSAEMTFSVYYNLYHLLAIGKAATIKSAAWEASYAAGPPG